MQDAETQIEQSIEFKQLERDVARRLAEEFLRLGDMDLHIAAGRNYHRLASEVGYPEDVR